MTAPGRDRFYARLNEVLGDDDPLEAARAKRSRRRRNGCVTAVRRPAPLTQEDSGVTLLRGPGPIERVRRGVEPAWLDEAPKWLRAA